jgi:peptidyl-prolyl cis-trans isomerase A (cyclophilin A)
MKASRCFFVLLLWALLAPNAFSGTLVQFHTSLGDMDVELYDKDKPITVKNFLRYVQQGLYTNSFLHRCPLGPGTVTDFVIQGGAFWVTNITSTNPEIFNINPFPPIVDEYASGTRYSNTYGTIAMAKLGGDTNSATCSWFFNLTNNPSLDIADTNNLFCVFGHVLRGTNVLNNFIGRSYFNGLQNAGVPFDSLPVNYSGFAAPTLTNVYYVNITVLNAQVTLAANGARKITWGSINGLTNNVEFATNLPPVWQVLASTNGTGSSLTVTDSVPSLTKRYYRVHVLY